MIAYVAMPQHEHPDIQKGCVLHGDFWVHDCYLVQGRRYVRDSIGNKNRFFLLINLETGTVIHDYLGHKECRPQWITDVTLRAIVVERYKQGIK